MPTYILDVPIGAYIRASLGVYEMTSVELLLADPDTLKTPYEGVLARYSLKQAEFFTWSNSQR
jgi:hypothetical protein